MRGSGFKRKHIDMVVSLALSKGKVSNRLVASCLGVDESTIRNWREAHPEFDRAFTDAHNILADKIAAAKSLIAEGVRTTTTTKEVIGKDGTRTTTTTTKTIIRPRRR
ncbi:hypothetical protein M942_22640 [Enterobacter ludwigii]|nr:hypothetical protein M942_22640 [Enterobacter ludwigii]